ncbi:hypothetical protein QR680_016171 [Steinernema hermaphroditum]|uniref:Uncharacterized protein n=1 Tax=Steinernema hermaphroditum TaxID=289476 RepID=A0AA39HB89_9BILA|nr:hypothetical protein QR680_016171 [Steinernema hermaphroditum]
MDQHIRFILSTIDQIDSKHRLEFEENGLVSFLRRTTAKSLSVNHANLVRDAVKFVVLLREDSTISSNQALVLKAYFRILEKLFKKDVAENFPCTPVAQRANESRWELSPLGERHLKRELAISSTCDDEQDHYENLQRKYVQLCCAEARNQAIINMQREEAKEKDEMIRALEVKVEKLKKEAEEMEEQSEQKSDMIKKLRKELKKKKRSKKLFSFC